MSRQWHEFFRSLGEGGTMLPSTRPYCYSQVEIDAYASLVGDIDPMHNDPDWEYGRTQWGGTIAIGTQSLARLGHALEDIGFPIRGAPGVTARFVKLPKARFIAPFVQASTSHIASEIVDIDQEGDTWRVKTSHTFTAASKPFLFAELVMEYVVHK